MTAKTISTYELLRKFLNEESAIRYFEEIRWNVIPTRPECGSKESHNRLKQSRFRRIMACLHQLFVRFFASVLVFLIFGQLAGARNYDIFLGFGQPTLSKNGSRNIENEFSIRFGLYSHKGFVIQLPLINSYYGQNEQTTSVNSFITGVGFGYVSPEPGHGVGVLMDTAYGLEGPYQAVTTYYKYRVIREGNMGNMDLSAGLKYVGFASSDLYKIGTNGIHGFVGVSGSF